ncbi:MAG: cobalamin synthesis protein P47K [Armatimonadia bacterium]|nr:cobalamin synthesis protein P47K [Armatimonadia bacterium]
MSKVRMILVGGFLGAGKTTLLAKAAKKLVDDGKRVGIITNDQATDLVDTGLLTREGIDVDEVAGGCFCCKFSDLESAAAKLVDKVKPDVLLGEPVGSCTDISATVLQPIKWLWGDWAEMSPFTVLTDPRRLREVLDTDGASSFPESVLYVFKKQLEEADYIAINKTDLVSPEELAQLKADTAAAYPDATVIEMSALEDTGVTEWLATVGAATGAGRRILDVDYDTYAEGEAVLGWLNASVRLEAESGADWGAFAARLMAAMRERLQQRSAEVAHLKILVATESGSLVSNITTLADDAVARGDAGSGTEAALTINARVHTDPETLRTVVEESVTQAARDGITADIVGMQNFAPAYPTPTHRFTDVVDAREGS